MSLGGVQRSGQGSVWDRGGGPGVGAGPPRVGVGAAPGFLASLEAPWCPRGWARPLAYCWPVSPSASLFSPVRPLLFDTGSQAFFKASCSQWPAVRGLILPLPRGLG